LLLFDRRLFVAREHGHSWLETARSTIGTAYRRLWQYRVPLIVAAVEFVAIIALLYAPRPDLSIAIANPGRLPGVLEAATIGSAEKLAEQWIHGGHEHSYIAYLSDALLTTATVSLPLVGFAVLGFLADRYTGDSPRDLVAFAFYWGAAIFFIYPAITDISAPWGLVHALVPLSIPAAVGLGLVLDRGSAAWHRADRIGVAVAGLVILAVLAQVGLAAAETSYRSPQADENPLVQYGQPAGHLQDTLAEVESIARENEGTDVVFYGEHFAIPVESVADHPPAGDDWHNRLPLAWYLERAGATVDSAKSPEAIEGEPPVVIARVEHYSELADRLSGYDARTYEITASNTETVIYVARD
jgi:uncharacterized protein (TIGR03663 family)